MELGATVCLPRKPLCLVCPLSSRCQARAEGTAAQLPVKLRKVEPVRISGELLIIRKNGKLLLRPSRVRGFQDLPLAEDVPGAKIGDALGEIRHTITHHHYTFSVRRAAAPKRILEPLQWWKEPIPLSTTARKALALEGLVYKL
jgi:A/G-specific adenine glycosylase